MKEPFVNWPFSHKQAPEEYFRNFTHELKQLQEGFYFKGKSLFIKLDSVISDAPARAFVKTKRLTMDIMDG